MVKLSQSEEGDEESVQEKQEELDECMPSVSGVQDVVRQTKVYFLNNTTHFIKNYLLGSFRRGFGERR